MSIAFVLLARSYPHNIGLIACINFTLLCAVIDFTVAASFL